MVTTGCFELWQGPWVVVTAPVSEYFDATQLQANNPSRFDVSVEVVSTGNRCPSRPRSMST